MTLNVEKIVLSINKQYPKMNHVEYETYLEEEGIMFHPNSIELHKLTIDQTLEIKSEMVARIRYWNRKGHITYRRHDNEYQIIYTEKNRVQGL